LHSAPSRRACLLLSSLFLPGVRAVSNRHFLYDQSSASMRIYAALFPLRRPRGRSRILATASCRRSRSSPGHSDKPDHATKRTLGDWYEVEGGRHYHGNCDVIGRARPSRSCHRKIRNRYCRWRSNFTHHGRCLHALWFPLGPTYPFACGRTGGARWSKQAENTCSHTSELRVRLRA